MCCCLFAKHACVCLGFQQVLANPTTIIFFQKSMWLVKSVNDSVTSFFTTIMTSGGTDSDRLYKFESLFNDAIQIFNEVRESDETARGDWINQTNIKTDLEQMVDLLIEEDMSSQRASKDGSSKQGEMGVCMEYLVQNHVIDALCGVAIIDNPKGSTELITCQLTRLFGKVSSSLLTIKPVHNSVSVLIQKFMQSFGQLRDWKLKNIICSFMEVCNHGHHSNLSIFTF